MVCLAVILERAMRGPVHQLGVQQHAQHDLAPFVQMAALGLSSILSTAPVRPQGHSHSPVSALQLPRSVQPSRQGLEITLVVKLPL